MLAGRSFAARDQIIESEDSCACHKGIDGYVLLFLQSHRKGESYLSGSNGTPIDSSMDPLLKGK